jgi:hypothetical protein
MRKTFYFLIILVIGIVIRLLTISSLPFDSDQAIVGLMGKHILEGALPWLYYGDSYTGTLEPALTSWSFLFWGINRVALHLIPFLFTILFIVSIYQLARELFNREIGLFSMLLAAVPPFSVSLYSALAYGGYIEILWLGNIILLITHRQVVQKASLSLLLLFFLGLLWGIAWWTHPISIIYLVTSCFFLIFFKKEWILRGKVLSTALGFLLGSCPFWIWNVKHDFPFLSFSRYNERPNWVLKITGFPEQLLDFFNESFKKTPSPPSYALTAIFLGAVLFLILGRKWLIKRFPSSQGPRLLLLFFTTFCLIYIGSRFSEQNALRYILPLYTIIPICSVLICYPLMMASRNIFIGLVVSILILTTYQQSSLQVFLDRNATRYNKQLQVEHTLFDFLRKTNHRYVYAPEYWSAAELTFNAREYPAFSLLFNDRYPLYTLSADASSEPVFVLEGKHRKSFEEMFRAAGGTYKKELFSPYQKIKGYVVYYDFKPPEVLGQEILPDLWTGKSHLNSGTEKEAFDRNRTTQWTSAAPQKPGMFFQVDLGKVYKINRLVLLGGKGKEWEFPHSYRIELSKNGRDWLEVSCVRNNWAYLFWSGGRPFWKLRDGRLENTFNPREARLLKITLTEPDVHSWSIGELFVYQAKDKAEAAPAPPEEIISFLSREKIKYVYADVGLSAQITLATRGKIKCLQDEYDITAGADYSKWGYNDAFPYFNQLKKRVNFSLSPAFVVAEENKPSFVRTLNTLPVTYSVKVFGNRIIYYGFKGAGSSKEIKNEGDFGSFYWDGTHLLHAEKTGHRPEARNNKGTA